MRTICALALALALAGCFFRLNPDYSPPTSSSAADAGADAARHGPSGGGVHPPDAAVADGAGAPADAAMAPCYSEPMSLSTPVGDLEQAFVPGPSGNWLDTTLAVLERRVPGGYSLLDAERSDPQLPNFVDPSSWSGVALNFSSMCNAETSGWDYAHATAGQFAYFMPATSFYPPSLQTFACSEIAAQLPDSSTQAFQMYLGGSCDLESLIDELDGFENGLSCSAAVGGEVSGLDARDGVAAFLYYLERYLGTARTAHPSVYQMMQASPDWQKVVRYAWARGFFWYGVTQSFPGLGHQDGPIWAHVNEPANLHELALFTGEPAAEVACHP